MTSHASALPGRPVFPRIELHEASVPSSPVATFSVVRAAEIAEADHGRQRVAQAWVQADRIVAEAHGQAAAHVAQMRAQAAAAQMAWYANQAALFEARTAQAVDLLCRATGQIAEAVIAAIFEQMPGLPIQASVEVAVRLLRSEMRSHVLCHALDFDAVNGRSAALGAVQAQTDETVRRGELLFRDAQGEVRVDGTDALLQLLADWKTALATTLPLPPSTPAATPSRDASEREFVADPSTQKAR